MTLIESLYRAALVHQLALYCVIDYAAENRSIPESWSPTAKDLYKRLRRAPVTLARLSAIQPVWGKTE